MAFRAVDKLRPHLSMLMGRSGFQALLTRALALAAAEFPWLAGLHVVADGELARLTDPHATFDAADIRQGEIALLSQLLRLLETFIGPALTMRLISQLWPQLSFENTVFDNTENDEEAK